MSFLGLTRYYRRFVKEFSSISSLLTKLTQKTVKFQCYEACEKSFQELKTRLNKARCIVMRPKLDWVVYLCRMARLKRRWLELLKDYDISILYHPGKANVIVDALSRFSMG
ncbi:hypothetical protein MTR67_001534, partial [Solanum verrucosum]